MGEKCRPLSATKGAGVDTDSQGRKPPNGLIGASRRNAGARSHVRQTGCLELQAVPGRDS